MGGQGSGGRRYGLLTVALVTCLMSNAPWLIKCIYVFSPEGSELRRGEPPELTSELWMWRQLIRVCSPAAIGLWWHWVGVLVCGVMGVALIATGVLCLRRRRRGTGGR